MKLFGHNSKNKNKIIEPSISTYINNNLSENITKIKNQFGNCSDLSINYYKLNNDNINFATIYIDNLVDKNAINSLSLELANYNDNCSNYTPCNFFNYLLNCLSGFREYNEGTNFDTLYENLLSGNIIFIVDGYNKFFSIDIYSVESRAVQEPTSQSIVRGPKESFTESIKVNTSLIRKRIKNTDLRVEGLNIGNKTKTKISLMYIDKVAKDEIINEIRKRLNQIKIDGILDSSYIEQLIKDHRYSIFPLFLNSEKPDSVTAELLEGKVAILVDGSPYVLTAPALFIEFFQTSEDYYHNFIVSSINRFLRFCAGLLTLLVPAVYIALTTFHHEAIPTPLLISISAQQDGVPFPSLVEVLLLEITFEILREAGIRMPRVVGSAISIVGALVLGQAAVEAGIISAVVVIIIALTAISSFAITNYEMANAIRIIRFPLTIIAGIFGLYGIVMSLIFLVLNLSNLKSIGVPYLTPIAPKVKGSNQDTIFRAPLWKMKLRPIGISENNMPRVDNEKPVSPKQKEKEEFR